MAFKSSCPSPSHDSWWFHFTKIQNHRLRISYCKIIKVIHTSEPLTLILFTLQFAKKTHGQRRTSTKSIESYPASFVETRLIQPQKQAWHVFIWQYLAGTVVDAFETAGVFTPDSRPLQGLVVCCRTLETRPTRPVIHWKQQSASRSLGMKQITNRRQMNLNADQLNVDFNTWLDSTMNPASICQHRHWKFCPWWQVVWAEYSYSSDPGGVRRDQNENWKNQIHSPDSPDIRILLYIYRHTERSVQYRSANRHRVPDSSPDSQGKSSSANYVTMIMILCSNCTTWPNSTSSAQV